MKNSRKSTKNLAQEEMHDLLDWHNVKLFFKDHGNQHLILEVIKTKEEPKIIHLKWHFNKKV